MVPDLDLQLQATIKALTDAVMPAVDPANKMAVEQLGLAIATLGMVRARIPLARSAARRALADTLELAAEVASAAPAQAEELLGQIDGARAALSDAAAETTDLASVVRSLNAAICAVIDACADGPAANAVEAIVIRRSRAATDLGRAWCLPAGFEPYPDRLPTIESLVR
jgi:hypothetical protein